MFDPFHIFLVVLAGGIISILWDKLTKKNLSPKRKQVDGQFEGDQFGMEDEKRKTLSSSTRKNTNQIDQTTINSLMSMDFNQAIDFLELEKADRNDIEAHERELPPDDFIKAAITLTFSTSGTIGFTQLQKDEFCDTMMFDFLKSDGWDQEMRNKYIIMICFAPEGTMIKDDLPNDYVMYLKEKWLCSFNCYTDLSDAFEAFISFFPNSRDHYILNKL